MGVLVTGGAGFIGSHMVLELLDAGEDVVVLDNLSTGFRWAVPGGAKFVEGDVGDHDLVRRLSSATAIDAIIHFAGSVVVPESVADPLGYYLNNTCKSRSLIASAVESQGAAFHLLVDRGGLRHAEERIRLARTRAARSRCRPTAPRSS